MAKKKYLLIALALVVLIALGYWFATRSSSTAIKDTTISFYTWNNSFSLDSTQKAFLANHKVKHLRVKVLEIGWNSATENCVVDNHITSYWGEGGSSYFLENELTPVVFLKNDLFHEIDSTRIPQLSSLVKRALQIHALDLVITREDALQNKWERLYFTMRTKKDKADSLQKVYERFLSHIVSYEFDCDWTEKTRDKYFYFLQNIKDSLKAPIETTLRLHQYKFRDKMGIPPVDAVNLMCYNMGDIKNLKEENSIFKKETLLQYMQGQEAYPLRLNMAFPLFGWTVVFRNDAFWKLEPGNAIVKEMENQEKIGPMTYRIKTDVYFSWQEESLQIGDVVRTENVSVSDIQDAYASILSKTKEKPEELIFFDLQTAVNKENIDELEKIIPR